MTDLQELLDGPAVDIVAAISSARYSAVEMVEAHLARIESVNSALNAVVTSAADRALDEARAADQIQRGGNTTGPLHGLPITIKDSYDTAGIRSTASTEGRRDHVPEQDATVVARLRAAGAILLGKTNTPELTMGDDTQSPLFGRTNNPYNVEYTPSGSSGGAAAILAAGGSALDIGSDTGGSIREPAHVCGIAGLKPSAGRVPRTGHAVPPGLGLIDSLTHSGPMARYVADVAMVLPIISGEDWRDPLAIPMPLQDYRDVRCEALRITWHDDNGLWTPHADVAGATRHAVQALAETGADTREVLPDAIPEMGGLHVMFRTADGGWTLSTLLASLGTREPGEAFKRRLDNTQALDTQGIAALLMDCERFKARMLEFMEDYDAIVCPPCPHPPWKHGSGINTRYEEWAYGAVFNVLGWPAIVVRAGTSADGLPIGVQVVGRPWREDVVLAIAMEIEQRCGGYQKPSL